MDLAAVLLGARRPLLVQPHYDDNDIGAAGTVRHWVLAGADVTYVSVTDDVAGARLEAVVVQRLFLGREHEVVVETREGQHRITLRLPSTQPPPPVGQTLGLRPLRACAFAP